MKQEPTCKTGSTSGTEIGEIRDQIEENWKFNGHLGSTWKNRDEGQTFKRRSNLRLAIESGKDAIAWN